MATLTKRERQDAKLTLAGTDRVARNVIEPGRYTNVTADATQLPTRYAVGDNNTNNLVINPNISGLLPGRPWNSTTSVYAILAFEPKLVFDFTGNVFKTGGADSTLANSVTHARAGHATMVDSDGLIKWAPHNLLPRSEEINVWGQAGAGSVVVDNAVAPDGTTTAATFTISSTNFLRYIRSFGTYTAGDIITFSFWVRSDTVTTLPFGINGGTNVANNPIFSDVAVTSTWQLVEFEFTVGGDDSSLYYMIGKQSNNPVNCQIGDVEIWHPHAYRSDLGGMVNNSATGNSYVPTTSSAVYAPRVGHHVYNGSAWVNEGILHESEARTNLCNHSDNPANWLSNPSGSFTFTAAQAVGSDGTLSLTKVAIGNTSTTEHEIYTTHSSINPSLGMTLSAELKNGDQRYVMLRQYIDANDWFAVTFDLVTGVVTQESVGSTGSVSIQSSGVIDLSNGLYRCWVSYIDISNTSSAGFPTIDAVTSGTPTLASNGAEPYSGTVGTHFYLGKMQLEQGSTPSSYIPTSGSTATRAAETLTVPAAKLPWPTPVVIGSELVTNSTFDSNTNDWTATTSTLSVDSNRLKVTNTGPFGQAIHTFPTVSGKTYLITADFIAGNAGNPDGYISVNEGQWGGVIYNGTSDGSSTDKSFSILFKATSHITKISLVNFFGSAGDFNLWDNVSVKEINPLALSIQMDGKMTYADGSSSYSTGHWTAGEATWFRWSAASTEFLYAGQATVASRTGQMIVGQRTLGTSFSSTISAFDYFKPDINVPFNIATRHSSTFLNGAADGTALTAATPAGMPDLSNSNLDLGFEFMGTIAQFRVWDEDLGDAGIAEATEPSTEPSLSLTFDGSENSFIVLDWSE